MNKIALSILGIVACGAAYALPVNNPADASLLRDGVFFAGDYYDSGCDSVNFRIGYQGDFVYNRKLKNNSSGRTITTTRLNTNAGFVVLNWRDRYDVYGLFGATNIYNEGDVGAFNPSVIAPFTQRIAVASETAFSWEVGARATLLEWGCFTVGIDGKYFSTEPNVRREVESSTLTLHSDSKFEYSEWQVALGAAYRIQMFVPYVAAVWADPHLDFSGTTSISIPPSGGIGLPDQRAQSHWGYAVGLTIIGCERISVTGEARFVGEVASMINAQLRF